MRFLQNGFWVFSGALALAALASCAEETYPPALLKGLAAGASTPASTAQPGAANECWQSRGESLPARLVAMSASTGNSDQSISADDLFSSFGTYCGKCHGIGVAPPGQGSFQIRSVAEFQKQMTASVLAHLQSDEVTPNSGADDPMPPPSEPTAGPYDKRAPTDPIKIWGDELAVWIADGNPGSFVPAGGSAAAAPSASGGGAYVLSSHVGNTMTNIGNCIPGPGLVGTEETRSAALDAMFAASLPSSDTTRSGAQQLGLPADLSDTDLVTFDSQVLAQSGVIAYAPGYPLWSDDAGKLRYIRVPRGTSIHFNKAQQKFDIPPNTRFYKTFMKKVVDADGSIRWRKMETRLIVARPDLVDANGNHTQTALFGSYQWNSDESDARLVDSLRADNTPFQDTIVQYDTDEPLAANMRISGDPASVDQSILLAGVARSYAIPGSERCIECHMGSPSAEFVLGFTPLQIARRPLGEGGTIEAAGPDELTQLQRFIDDGVITGIDSPSDVLPLEASQGARTPRNEQELTAQGYLLGNCSHCHNPIGFPTVQNPILKDVLNFLPSAQGGIFQFPLERYSPRIFRGLAGTPMPYITPSLMDFPEVPVSVGSQPFLPFAQGGGDGDVSGSSVVYAPWRSLIYRNVDSAFTYADDYTIFPHMPFNTPGYDPRLKQIVSDWMVSIPAVRKRPDTAEYSFYTASVGTNSGGPVDPSPQPYVEVLSGDPLYPAAFEAAQARLAVLHTGVNPALPDPQMVYSRYADPDDTTDIVDPQVTADPVCHPVPTVQKLTQPSDLYPLPRHPNWVKTDLTSPPGYVPRRPDWNQILVDREPPVVPLDCPGKTGALQANADQSVAIGLLQNIDLDPIRTFATTPIPFGLWKQKAVCNFAAASQDPSAPVWSLSAPPVSAFVGSSRPAWMDVVQPAADAPVFQQLPGQAVFKMICINCHGPLANSQGRFAVNLATITGGNAHVADFRDGFFGPQSAPETNIQNQFGSVMLPDAGTATADASSGVAPTDGGTLDGAAAPATAPQWAGIPADDVAARYMSWMALGGTSVSIPAEILQLVAETPVLGQSRFIPPSVTSANMLSAAKQLCTSLLGYDYLGEAQPSTSSDGFSGPYLAPPSGKIHPQANSSFIATNGDGALWLKLCSLNNPSPVHILAFATSTDAAGEIMGESTNPWVLASPDSHGLQHIAFPSTYPANSPIGNDSGSKNEMTGSGPCGGSTGVSCIRSDNLWPWCVDVEITVVGSVVSSLTAANTAILQKYASDNNLPICPDAVLQSSSLMTESDGNAWAVRGAINAGLSVFLYLQWLEKQSVPPLDYDQCDLLPQP